MRLTTTRCISDNYGITDEREATLRVMGMSGGSLRASGVVMAALGCLLVLVGLIAPPGTPRSASHRWASHRAAAEMRLPVTGAAWVRADRPDTPAGPHPLYAGDVSGGAVTYLRFTLPYGAGAGRVTLELTSATGSLPSLVELAQVPETDWEPGTLTWSQAPVPGRAAPPARAGSLPGRVTFDLTGRVGTGGTYAFAVTVPPDQGHAAFVGPGGGPGAPELRLSGAEGYAVPTASPGRPAPVRCVRAAQLVPSCGVLWGVAPAAHTSTPRTAALTGFEQATGRQQDIYHAYHRSQQLFPTPEEVAIAAEGRILFLNWKPYDWSWAQVARGHPTLESYLDRLAAHITETFTEPFFFTVHHEPENDVQDRPGSGYQPADYAAMFRYVVEGLRARGVSNLVTVMNYMAYVPWNAKPWFPELYPGDDVVDWIGWDSYAYSDPGFGYGDFGELMNRRDPRYPDWPGFYTWAATTFPDKPFMLSEWGVWHSPDNPGHMAALYDSVARQVPLFPRVRAMVYFETPSDVPHPGQDSRPAATAEGLAAFQRLGAERFFQVGRAG